jgi:hypothetical protein
LVVAVVFATLVSDEELCAAGFAGVAAVCAAKVNGTAAAVRASARIVFFMAFFSSGPFLYRPLTNPSCVFAAFYSIACVGYIERLIRVYRD